MDAASVAVDAASKAETGLSMWTLLIAFVVIIVIGMVMTSKSNERDDERPSIAIHAKQLKFMEDIEEKYCSGNTKGKGIRCIIDYMRESTQEHVTEILAETPKYTEGFVSLEMDLHGRQIDFLASIGIEAGTEKGPDQYNDLSKAFRTMLDYAMRMEAGGSKDKIEDMFGNVRCLNC
jgi:hypothetical protein